MEKRVASIQDEDASLRATLEQAAVSLDVPESRCFSRRTVFSIVYRNAHAIDTLCLVTKKEGIFFLPDGSEVKETCLILDRLPPLENQTP